VIKVDPVLADPLLDNEQGKVDETAAGKHRSEIYKYFRLKICAKMHFLELKTKLNYAKI
jgi:hypothetical protein